MTDVRLSYEKNVLEFGGNKHRNGKKNKHEIGKVAIETTQEVTKQISRLTNRLEWQKF